MRIGNKMTEKTKIDWYGVGFLSLMFSVVISIIINIKNIENCLLTYNYCVWICDFNTGFIITLILLCLWSVWVLIMMFQLCCLRW